jgi:hypothetical protein
MATDIKFEDLGTTEFEDHLDAALPEDLTAEEKQKKEWLAQPAPYGRFKSGKPKKTPPKGTPKAKTAARKSRPNQPDYEQGINGLFQMVSFGLAVAGTNNRTLLADSVTVAKHGPPFAHSIANLAHERPEIAAVLDKALAVGPYSEVLAFGLPLVMQLIANHGVKLPGTQTADELIAEAEAEYKQAMPDAA